MRSKLNLFVLLVLASLLCMTVTTPVLAQKTAPSGPTVDPPSLCDAISSNLVQNCGFETGDFTDWHVTNAASGSLIFVSGGAYSGNNAAWFGAVTYPYEDSISQILTDNVGATYTLSFFLSNDYSAPGQAIFSAYWDGTDLFDASANAFPYTQYTFTVTGTGSDTLQFSGVQVPAYYILDDVSVVATPEPGTLGLLGTGMLCGLALLAFRRL